MDPKKVLSLIGENDKDVKDYSNIKLDDLKRGSEDELLLIIIKHIFFFNDNKFHYKAIREGKKSMNG